MIKQVYHLVDKVIVDELLRVGKIKRDWLELEKKSDENYKIIMKVDFQFPATMFTGADLLGFWSTYLWLRDGPKIFRPSLEQCKALEQIEVNIPATDYTQPYPGILIDLPPNEYNPFVGVICGYGEKCLIFNIISFNKRDDVVCVVYTNEKIMEITIQKFDADLECLQEVSRKVLRIAINACLMLVNYPHQTKQLYPNDYERDTHFAKEKTERGERARERLAVNLQLVTFAQEITLHETKHERGEGEDTGRKVKSHWRKGHWAMQAYGPKNSLRKRILRKPVLVHSDLFLGDLSDTSVIYRK